MTSHQDLRRTDTTTHARATTRRLLGPLALAGAGVAIATGGLLHPSGDPIAQLASPWWTTSHAVLMAGMLLLAIGAAACVVGRDLPRPVRTATGVTAVAAILSVGELVPHLLAATDLHALEHGGAHPFYDIHLMAGPVTNAVIGLSLAVLAVLAAPSRALGLGSLPAALAVVGGVAFAAAAPLIVATGVGAFGVLFSGSVLMGLWLLISGVTLLRRG